MTVFRTTDIILVAVMICAAAITYKVKSEAQKRYQEVRQIERKIEAEKDTINLLRADWALMTQPARLQRLALQYKAELGLEPVQPEQFVKAADIPEKTADSIHTIIEDSKALIVRGVPADKTDIARTGSIRP